MKEQAANNRVNSDGRKRRRFALPFSVAGYAKSNMKILAIILALFIGATVAMAGGPVLPDGWRLPSDKELSDEWRSGERKNAEAIGDFNGDGLIEGAFLAVSKDEKYEGLLAFIYQEGKEKWFVLSKEPLNGTVFMGLDKWRNLDMFLLPVWPFQVTEMEFLKYGEILNLGCPGFFH